MPTLASELGETAPVSYVVKQAQRLGLRGIEEAIQVAASRGCRHYTPTLDVPVVDPGRERLSDEALIIFLVSGEHVYSPTAIRCAAQMMRSPHVKPTVLARLAVRLKCDRVLRSIAWAGFRHDPEGRCFWTQLLADLPAGPQTHEPKLPHWSRYVSMPGIQRDGMNQPQWLKPRDQPSKKNH